LTKLDLVPEAFKNDEENSIAFKSNQKILQSTAHDTFLSADKEILSADKGRDDLVFSAEKSK
jgi:hypothetical protein